jgi:hypothetical protein
VLQGGATGIEGGGEEEEEEEGEDSGRPTTNSKDRFHF